MKKIIILLTLLPFLANAQNIPKDANVIIVKKIGFLEVCNALLDSGYTISKKDNDLQTVSTENKEYPKFWNATYKMDIRIKDSVAYISGTVTAPPGGGLYVNEPLFNHTNKKGVPFPKSLFGFAFQILNNFALSFNKEISYSIKK